MNKGGETRGSVSNMLPVWGATGAPPRDSQIQVDGVSDLTESSQTTSLHMVNELEEFCENEAHKIVVRSYDSVILFCTWVCM